MTTLPRYKYTTTSIVWPMKVTIITEYEEQKVYISLNVVKAVS